MSFISFKSQTIRQASTLLALTGLLSNVLGLVRNLLFYHIVPLNQLDVYFASFRIPDFIFNLIIFGAITSAVIPVLTEQISKGQEKIARNITNQLLSWATVILLLLGIVLIIEMPFLVRHLVPGFDEARLTTTILTSRLILLQTLFFSWSYIVGALLNSYNRFLTYSLAPLLYNLALIIGGIMAGHYGILAIVYALLVGAFLSFFIQLLEIRRTGYFFRFDLTLSTELKEIVRLMIPRSLSQGMNQVVWIIYTNLASVLQAGSLAVFTGANDLQTTPTVIIANSVAVASFPTLAAQVARKEWGALNALITKLIRASLFLLLPILALSLVLDSQVIHLYFRFDSNSQSLTPIAIRTFALFIISIIPASLVVILARVFYASKDTRTPMVIGLSSSLLGIIISYTGIHILHTSVVTLAVAETAIASSQALLYLIILEKRGQIHLRGSELLPAIGTYIFGSLLLAVSCYATTQIIHITYATLAINPVRLVSVLLETILATLVGSLVYLGYSKVKCKEELLWLRNRNLSNKT